MGFAGALKCSGKDLYEILGPSLALLGVVTPVLAKHTKHLSLVCLTICESIEGLGHARR